MEILVISKDLNGQEVRYFAHKQWRKNGKYLSFQNTYSGCFASAVFVQDDFGNLVLVGGKV